MDADAIVATTAATINFFIIYSVGCEKPRKIAKMLGDFLNPALALLGQGLKKSPIGQKLDFVNHPYLCKGL
jgi:hypothetical protein